MQIKKWIATGLTALMAGATLATSVIAATQLSNYPTFLGSAGSLDAFLVVGKFAKTEDVVGAIDVAANLVGKTSYKATSVTGTSAIDGIEKDTFALPSSSSGTALSTAFPSSGVLKTFHFTGLKDSVVTWKGTDYDFHEQVDVAAANFRHGLTVSSVNGTEKLVVADGNIKYEYVFDKMIRLDTASADNTKGSISNPDYTNYVKAQLMGKDFLIVGAGSTSLKMLTGSVGTATSISAVTYGDYSVYSDLGNNGNWARIIIKDASANPVETKTINQGSTEDFTTGGLRVKVTSVKALQDGTIVGADVVVGTTATGIEKEYGSSADVSTSGTSGTRFPGETLWGIQYSAGTNAGQANITTGSKIQVIYKPSTTEYYVAGTTIKLPNNYGELGYTGWNTDKFATITIAQVTGKVVHNSTDSQIQGNLNGWEISSDQAGSIISTAGNAYSKAYVLFNRSRAANNQTPVMIGFYDSVKQKIIVNDSWTTAGFLGGPNGFSGAEYGAQVFAVGAGEQRQYLNYSFKLNYGNVGEQDYYLHFNITNNNTGTISFGSASQGVTAGKAGSAEAINFTITNKTAVSDTGSTGEFRIGFSAATSEENEIRVNSEGSFADASKKSQEITTDGGLLLQDTSSSGAADKVVFKVPAKDLKIKAYFGKAGAATTGGTVNEFVAVTAAVAKLDNEVGAADKAKNLVLVGGPCVNTLVQDLVNSGKLDAGYSCAGGVLGSKWTANTAYIIAVDDAFTTGKVALVVAGTVAADTRVATTVLQNYATYLAGKTASTVTINTGATTPVVT